MMSSLISYFKVLYVAVCAAITSILTLLFPKKENILRKNCANKIVNLVASDIEIEGKIDKDAQLFIGNHTDNLDIPIMEVVFKDEKIVWIAKKELGEIPIYKYLLTKTDMILTDRSDKRSILRLLKDVKDRVFNKKLKVFVFPEGTRNKKNYKRLLPFKSGVKILAEKLNLKIQPFVIINVPKIISNKPFKIEKQKIKVVFLDSFYPYDGWYNDVKQKMEEILKKEYNET